jgi:Cof subfamily protein (haloacid dehalogenase superfamily)
MQLIESGSLLREIIERNKKLKKLIVADLDGTLLRNNSELYEGDAIAVKRFLNEEVKLTIATGRSFESALPFIKQLGIDLPVICELGAFIVDPVSNSQIVSYTIPPDILNEILLFFKKSNFSYNIYLCSGNNYNCFKGHNSPIYLGKKVAIEMDDDLKNIFNFIFKDIDLYNDFRITNVRKISIRTDPEEYSEVRSKLEESFGSEVMIRRSDINCVDISPFGITKGTGLKFLIDLLHIDPKNVMVIGDNETDATMFDVVENSFAVDNADPQTKEKAKFVVPSNEEGGVIYAIEQFLRNSNS